MEKLQILFAFFILACAVGDSKKITTQIFERPLVINSREVVQTLYIDNAYHDAGIWGPISICPNNALASSIEVTYKPPGGSITDETAINGIKLYCNTVDEHNSGYVTSSVGNAGESQGNKICQKNFINGFRAKTLEYQGTFTDDVALQDLEVYCNNGLEIIDTVPNVKTGSDEQPLDFGEGTWSSTSQCRSGSAVCGIQTRVEDGSLGDGTAVCEFVFFCCDIPATNATKVD